MLLKRRSPPGWLEWVRVWLWPRRSWMRSGQYVTKRVLRLTASPHAIAAGVAAGAMTSFSPLLGFHFMIAFILAWVIRGNLLAAALGTFVGNPITFPFIWAATYKAGHFLLGTAPVAEGAPGLGHAMTGVVAGAWAFDLGQMGAALNEIWTPLLWPMMIGGLVLGPLIAVPLYFATRRASMLFREARQDQLMAKAAQLRDRAKALQAAGKVPRNSNSSAA